MPLFFLTTFPRAGFPLFLSCGPFDLVHHFQSRPDRTSVILSIVQSGELDFLELDEDDWLLPNLFLKADPNDGVTQYVLRHDKDNTGTTVRGKAQGMNLSWENNILHVDDLGSGQMVDIPVQGRVHVQ